MTARVLPFRFVAAARYAPQWETLLEQAMLSGVGDQPMLKGKTVPLADVSGSMDAPLSRKVEMTRADPGYGLAVLLRELCETLEIDSFSDRTVRIPARRGFALREAIHGSQSHSGTMLGAAVEAAAATYDRLIVTTDEQAHDQVPAPTSAGYVIDLASYEHGVGYGLWIDIDGGSGVVIDFMREFESYRWVN